MIVRADAYTDIGRVRSVNQDAYAVRVIEIGARRAAFAVVCDGMGGLLQGETISGAVVCAFLEWFREFIPELGRAKVSAVQIHHQWQKMLERVDRQISFFMKREGMRGGTTVTALLLADRQYTAVHVGDSRLYLIDQLGWRQITRDHTLVQQEVEGGLLTPEAAKVDPRKNILTRCVGVEEYVQPEYYAGTVDDHQMFLLCSDGFRHFLTERELYQILPGEGMVGDGDALKTLVERAKERGETDNITAVTIETSVDRDATEYLPDSEDTVNVLYSEDGIQESARVFWNKLQEQEAVTQTE